MKSPEKIIEDEVGYSVSRLKGKNSSISIFSAIKAVGEAQEAAFAEGQKSQTLRHRIEHDIEELDDEIKSIRGRIKVLNRARDNLHPFPLIHNYPCDVCGAPPKKDCKHLGPMRFLHNAHYRKSGPFRLAKEETDKKYTELSAEIKALWAEIENKSKRLSGKKRELESLEDKDFIDDIIKEIKNGKSRYRSIELMANRKPERGKESSYKVIGTTNFYSVKAGDTLSRETVDLFDKSNVSVNIRVKSEYELPPQLEYRMKMMGWPYGF